MKKISCLFITLISLVFYSFTSSNTKVSYKENDFENKSKKIKELGSFVAFEETRYTSDKTEWNKRRQTWTDFAKITNLESLEKTINNN